MSSKLESIMLYGKHGGKGTREKQVNSWVDWLHGAIETRMDLIRETGDCLRWLTTPPSTPSSRFPPNAYRHGTVMMIGRQNCLNPRSGLGNERPLY